MSCPKGKIRRSSYNKKAHLRRSYKRSSGKRVGSSYVSRTYVPSTCVRDTGKPGKTPSRQRILPPIGKKIHFAVTVILLKNQLLNVILRLTKPLMNLIHLKFCADLISLPIIPQNQMLKTF